MGGGHVTRPDFHISGPDPHHPLTEFYLLVQAHLSHERSFALPGAYAAFQPPPGMPLFEEDVRDYCRFRGSPAPGYIEVFPPRRLHLLYDDLRVDPSGAPAALVLTEESSRRTFAVQLAPPFWGRALPLPDCTAALTLRLTDEDLLLVDRNKAALARRLCSKAAHKEWLNHPALDRWLTTALAAAQRAYRRGE